MASKAIKGITVEIGGDTTKLGKAIDGAEKKSRSLQVELRQVEKLLQFDPTNTELLTQKQKILSDSVAETSKKLNTLKEAEKQVIAQFEKGEVSEEQVRALQREIIQTEKVLRDMESELRVANKNLNEYGDNNGYAREQAAKLEKIVEAKNKALQDEKNALKEAEKAHKEHEKAVKEAKEELKDFKDKAEDAYNTLKTGAAILGGAAGAVGGYALKLNTDFDKAFNTLITQTGASADEMDSLNEAMENVYSNNFGDSIEDVAQSMATVKQNTKLSGEELEKATERALLMRDTFEFDVNESTRTAKMLMDQYGVSADDAYNLIAQGAQNGLNKNGDLLDTINEYSVHFSQLGLSAEDTFNMLANGAESGTFSVDKLGDAVKEFGIRVKDGTADDAFKELGFSVDETTQKFAAGGEGAKQALGDVTKALFNVRDPVEQNRLGVELFGTMWEDLGADGVKALMSLEGEISTTKTALDDINNQKYDDIGSAIQGLKRTLDTEIINPLGDELKPVVEDVIGYVQDNAPEIKSFLSEVVSAVGDFVGFLVDNGSTIVSVIAGIGTGMLVWDVASTINSVVGAIKAFKKANEAATAVQALFNAVMNANPIMLIVTIIAAVVAAIATFILTNEDAREKFVEIWNKIVEVVKGVIDKIVEFFTVTIPEAWNNFLAWLPTFIDGVVNWFAELPGKIWTFLSDVISKIVSWGSDIKEKASAAVSELVSKVVNWFAQLPGKIWTWLTDAINRIVTWGSNMKSKAVTAVSNLVSSVISWFAQLPGKIWSAISGAISQMVSWGNQMISKAVSAISNLVSRVFSSASQLPGKIWSAIQGAISKVVSWGSSLASAAGSAVRNMVSRVVSIAGQLPSKFVSIGRNIIEGIKNGIGNAVSGLYTSIKRTLGGLVDKAKEALGINSPSKVFANIVGKAIPEGVAKGIDDNSNIADKAVLGMTDSLTDEAINLNGATINRKLSATFNSDSIGAALNNETLLGKLDNIYEKLSRMQIVLDTGTLVGETIEKIDYELNYRQTLAARGI